MTPSCASSLQPRLLRAAAVVFLLAAGTIPVGPARAQGEDEDDFMARINAIGREISAAISGPDSLGNHLGVRERLETLRDELDADPGLVDQMLSTYRMNEAMFLGRHEEALAIFDARFRAPEEPAAPEPIEDARPHPALDVVLSMADTARVIMINEAHHVPRHRLFTLELLRALREKGFTHFAAEALDPRDAGLAARGYPTRETGYYTREPLFGDVIRTALALGYELVPYEAMESLEGPPEDRELVQARNLRDRVFAANPDAKLLVHVGHQHLDESGTLGDGPPMAARFRELTGIDPLTLEQTKMSERAKSGIESPRYRWAEREGLLRGITVFVREGAPWSLDAGRWDVTIFHPRTELLHGRPTWLTGAGRVPVPLPDDAERWPRPVMVEARLAAEGEDAIPLDRILIAGGEPLPALMLPSGEYRIRVTDVEGAVVASYGENVVAERR